MKKIWVVSPLLIIAVACLILFTVISYWSAPLLFAFELCVTLAIIVLAIANFSRIRVGAYQYLKLAMKALNGPGTDSSEDYPVPALLVGTGGEILWYNALFRDSVLKKEDQIGQTVQKVFGQTEAEDLFEKQSLNITYQNRHFTVYGRTVTRKSKSGRLLYFIDDTELKNIAHTYAMTKPSVLYLVFDNYEEMTSNTKESERGAILGAVESVVENYLSDTGGFSLHINRDRFILLLEERSLTHLIENKFPLLDKMREIKRGERTHATVSIGVGLDAASLKDGEQMARQALDMALGRGGDQAAVKTKTGYTFYGGLSKGVEKRTKVRSRIIAKALSELIESSENVFLMGHRFGDLDSIGAAIALYSAARAMNKPAYIVADEERNLSLPLIARYTDNPAMFILPAQALPLVTKKSLLIIADTHNPEFLESKDFYEAVKSVVVIDHHRKMVNYIDNAVIFFHEPYASSACEMVTELVEYMENVQIGQAEAEALLSGIMLDTKNFVMKTGVRTFEAAAYLKRLGADTVAVKQLFSGSMDSYTRKSQMVSGAQIYKNYAISSFDGSFEDIRVIASQAADELLSINGVDASFVMYAIKDEINISARSMGVVNVQVIMEKLGGGGHQTMAAAQLTDTTIEQANIRLIEVLDTIG